MATILQHLWIPFFFKENNGVSQMSLTYVSKDLINNKSALVQMMVWRRRSEKPLFETILAYFIFTTGDMCHSISLIKWTSFLRPC